jgi:hypothetical protein
LQAIKSGDVADREQRQVAMTDWLIFEPPFYSDVNSVYCSLNCRVCIS